MSELPFKIYKSSAGSGKTYTLVREYLRLALERPTYYRHILAVTFTNKATSEMKTRVIESLSDFVNGKDNPMATELKAILELDNAAFQKKSQEVLSNILHGYAHFSVSTIDAFFQKIIRSFAKEVGLYGGFKLELEQDQVLDRVVDQLVDELSERDQLTHWLVDFAQEKVNAGKSWDVKRDIKNLSKELFGETLKGISSQLDEFSKDRSRFSDFQAQLKAIISTFEREIGVIGEQALSAISSAGLEVTDFSYGKGGAAGYFAKIVEGKEYKYGNRVKGALDNTEAWYAKKSPHIDKIDNIAASTLIPLLNEAVDYHQANSHQYQSAVEVSKQLYSFAILSDVASKLQQYKTDEGVMLISDSGEFLHRIIKDNDTPFVYEKVGSFFSHYLIDEFQDTSGFQWENFRPLIENGLAEGNMSMVVGDAKQSIYRWRGGDPMILQSTIQSQIGADYTSETNLATNYRSAGKVVGFNNLIFKHFAQRINGLLTVDDLGEEMSTWLTDEVKQIVGVYEDVAQLVSPSKQSAENKGFVSFSFVENNKEEDLHWKDMVLEQLPQWLEKLQDQGVNIEEIAILVRKASEAKLVMDTMIEYQQGDRAKEGYSYDLISNESLQVGSASVVQIMLNIFRYLQNPRDQVARANIVYAYQYKILERSEEDLHELLSADDVGRYLPLAFVDQQEALNKKPLYELTEILLRIFGLQKLTNETAYLQAFQDVVLEYVSTKSNDLHAFLEWWEENSSKQKVKLPSTVKAAQILTIHKAKGLQFKAVILPFVSWAIDHEPTQTNIIWTKSDETPYDQLPIIPLKYGKSLANTVFAKAYYREKMSAYLDNLNLLYVAFTRAEDYLIGYGLKQKDKTNRVSDVLYQLLGSVESLSSGWDEESMIFSCGEMKQPIKPDIRQPNNKPTIYVSHDWNEKLKVKYRATSFFGDEDEKMKGVNFGNLLHELMSRVVTLDQLPKALQAMYYEGMINTDQMLKLEDTTKEISSHPVVSTWFDPQWEVKTEVPILPISGEMSRLDRVMIDGQKAVVVDYKTGDRSPKYAKQVANYKKLLSEMGYEEVKGYLLYVDEMDIVEV